MDLYNLKLLNLHTMKNPEPPTAENGENLDQYEQNIEL